MFFAPLECTYLFFRMYTKSFYFVPLPCPVHNTCTIRIVSILLIQNNHTKSSPLRFLFVIVCKLNTLNVCFIVCLPTLVTFYRFAVYVYTYTPVVKNTFFASPQKYIKNVLLYCINSSKNESRHFAVFCVLVTFCPLQLNKVTRLPVAILH